ncbi:hypothetical protein [Amycolatopsis sp. NPDC051071]|uniref:hypothetical protein n=1 Tax=Amycolatopsis sp. NPDC051071 TaxID=3154637 RepID=UPI00341809BE
MAAVVTPGGYLPDVDSRGPATAGEAKVAGVDIITPDDCKQRYLDGFSGEYWHNSRDVRAERRRRRDYRGVLGEQISGHDLIVIGIPADSAVDTTTRKRDRR